MVIFLRIFIYFLQKQKDTEERKKQRYKMLISLLEKSEFYSNFMREKVDALLKSNNR